MFRSIHFVPSPRSYEHSYGSSLPYQGQPHSGVCRHVPPGHCWQLVHHPRGLSPAQHEDSLQLPHSQHGGGRYPGRAGRHARLGSVPLCLEQMASWRAWDHNMQIRGLRSQFVDCGLGFDTNTHRH